MRSETGSRVCDLCDEAIEVYRRLVAIDSDRRRIEGSYTALAAIYEERGQEERARRMLEAAHRYASGR